jgi:hypothetical protein
MTGGLAGRGVLGGRAAGGAARRAAAGWRTAGVRGREGSGETSPGERVGRPAAGARRMAVTQPDEGGSAVARPRCANAGTAAALPEARRYSDEIAGKCQSGLGDRIRAPGLPRGSRWGRWREGVLTRPKPQAARYPAGCPPLSAAKCGEAEEACPNVSRGFGGMCPPSLPFSDEGEAKLPISARYLRAWAAQASRGTRPSPPLSCGVARRWQRRALPTCEAGGMAVSGGAGGPAGAAAPEALLLAGKNDTRTQRLCGQRGLLAPRYPARGAGRCRGAVSAAILRRAPRSGWVGSGCGFESPKGRPGDRRHRIPERSRASSAAILPPCAASVLLRAYPPDKGAASPAAILRRRHRCEGAAPFSARYPAGVGAATEFTAHDFCHDERAAGRSCPCSRCADRRRGGC